MNISSDKIVDAKGLSCPMPIVRTKKAMNELTDGQVLEVQATDKGSKADIKAWSESSGHQYLGTIEKEDGILIHFIRKASQSEEKEEKAFPHTFQNTELEKILENEEIQILDVREEAEYAFGHLPGAISIPLGELEERMGEMKRELPVYVICRTGNRSDLAAQKLSEKGFAKVFNVLPGMVEWKGQLVTESK